MWYYNADHPLRRYFSGRPLINFVDKRLGYPTPAARRGEVPY